MAIKQISTSNTFGEWVESTRQLIDKYNYVESTANIIFIKSDSVNVKSDSVNVKSDSVNSRSNIVNIKSDVVNIKSDVVNIKSDVVNVKSDSVNSQTALVLSISNNIQLYVNTAYSTTNSAFLHANGAFLRANGAFDKANGAFLHANSSFDKANVSFLYANSSFEKANGAFDKANGSFLHANGAFLYANSAYDRVNTVYTLANTANLALITNDNTTNSDQRYIVFTTQSSGLLTKVNVSSQGLSYNPNTGVFKSPSANFTGNGVITLPSGTTLQRPSSPTPGDIRYNIDTSEFEGYTTEWGSIGGGGGFSVVEIKSANSTMNLGSLHVITSNITLTLPSTPTSSDIVGISNMSGYANSVIARNGSNIMGLAEDLSIDVVDIGFSLIYTDATRGWIII